jgi:hypothetical protein
LSNKVLLGDNAFIGVNHTSQERARETLLRLNSDRITGVMRTAFSAGAEGFVFSTHPTNLASLLKLKKEHPELAFGIYPLLPYAQGYIRTMNEKGSVAVLKEFMGKLSTGGKFRAFFGGGVSAITMNPYKLLSTFVDAEMDTVVQSASQNCKLEGIFLHEIIVDLGVSLKLEELFRDYVNHVKDSFHIKAGLVTRNLPLLAGFLRSIDQNPHDVVIMTPFNKIGFQMNPSREECEKVLMEKNGFDIVAMSVLAGGILDPIEGLDYLNSLGRRVSCVVGASTEMHARTTFAALSRGLRRPSSD